MTKEKRTLMTAEEAIIDEFEESEKRDKKKHIFNPLVLEWSGTITSAIAAIMIALKIDISAWGFVVFMISGMFWIGFGIQKKAYGFILLQLILIGIDILGIWRWFFAT